MLFFENCYSSLLVPGKNDVVAYYVTQVRSGLP